MLRTRDVCSEARTSHTHATIPGDKKEQNSRGEVLPDGSNQASEFFGRSLSQEEVISSRANGVGINSRNSLLRSSSDCTGTRRLVHPQPLMSRYNFERRSIRRSKVILYSCDHPASYSGVIVTFS